MGKIRTFNAYTNGNQSKINVYFADGTEWHRTITAEESVKAKEQGAPYIAQLMAKYEKPQPAVEYVKPGKSDEQYFTRRAEHIIQST